MNDIKAARLQYDCRLEVEKCLGRPYGRGKSWVWPCPFHDDDTPSFHVYKNGYHCYGCGEHGDVFDWWAFWQNKPLAEILHQHQLDPREAARRKAEYAERAAQELQEKIEQAQAALDALRSEQSWLRYHKTVKYDLWEQRYGIPQWYVDFIKFGYDPEHVFYVKGQEYRTPTLTIPVYEPGWNCVNVRHRLLNEPPDGGKYRPERSGLPASLFVADPDRDISGKVMVCEGEIKAAKVFVTADDPNMQVVGLPGKTPSEQMLSELADADPIYLCLDPDAELKKIVRTLGKERVLVIRLPEKIDDMINAYGLDKSWMAGLLASARKA